LLRDLLLHLPSLTWFAVAGHTLLLRLGEGKITL
jgi:hypothetical protein